MRVELFYRPGCASYPEAQLLLEDVLRSRGVHYEIDLREVATEAQARAVRFPGSPTIRIEGRDVDARGAAGKPSLSCRKYHLPDGRVSPIPSREQLESALG